MPSHMAQWELSILTCMKRVSDSTSQAESDLVNLFLQGHYEKFLESNGIAQNILSFETNGGQKFESLGSFIIQNIKNVLTQNEDVHTRDLAVLITAASCLQLFVQNNWLGPPTSKSPLQFCHKAFQDKQSEVLTEAQEELSQDGESVYAKSRHSLYLYIARVILLEFKPSFAHVQTWDWWLMRCLLIQQNLLFERSPTLKATVFELIEDLPNREPLMTDDANREVQVLFHIEAGYACHTYYEYKQAEDNFNAAKKRAGLSVELSGAMGKRTRFQIDDKAQLILRLEREEGEQKSCFSYVVPTHLPKNYALDDDTVLESVKYADEASVSFTRLTPVEEVVVLGQMENLRRSRAQERLTNEEVQTYISHILSNVSVWGVAVAALCLRSKLERDSRRRVERSMKQFEETIKLAVSESSTSDVSQRTPLFYATHLSPVWSIRADFASILLSLGLIGEALDVYEKLELWDDVILCYQKLNKLEKAESVIRARLAVKETPSMLCFLGDVTRDIEYYKKAWELSNHRNARSMRCMGYNYFQAREYEKAMECFGTSLEINALQVPVWFTYGCTAMTCEKFDVGAKAFRRCVTIDYDNFEAWSNLSTCFVKLKDKHKAYATLQEAVKCNYENWQLWENCLIIGTDVGEFEDVIRAYNRLMDIKEKWVDNEILSILTRAVLEKIPDAHGRPADRLVNKLCELFGRITSKVTSEGEIWTNYAKLCSVKIVDREPDLEKAAQHLQKAYRCFTQKSDWEKDKEQCKKICTQALDLAKVYVEIAEGKSQEESLRLLASAKLMLKGALVKVQKQHTDPISQVLDPEVVDICQAMDTRLSEIMSRIETVKNV